MNMHTTEEYPTGCRDAAQDLMRRLTELSAAGFHDEPHQMVTVLAWLAANGHPLAEEFSSRPLSNCSESVSAGG